MAVQIVRSLRSWRDFPHKYGILQRWKLVSFPNAHLFRRILRIWKAAPLQHPKLTGRENAIRFVKRWVPYGKVYPFGEAFAGLAMTAGALFWMGAPMAIIIGGIGAFSIIKAVYIDKRVQKCACVGGKSNVPLGFISRTGNLMMLGMGGWMLAPMLLDISGKVPVIGASTLVSRKVWKPSRAGRIDRRDAVAHTRRMRMLKPIYAMTKTLVCAAFVFALVLLPPSAAHASANMHGGHHSAPETLTVGADHQNHDMSQGVKAAWKCGSVDSAQGQDHAAGKCCSGICSSVVLNETAPVFVGHTIADRYIPLQAQANSVELSGFLRPPQFLI